MAHRDHQATDVAGRRAGPVQWLILVALLAVVVFGLYLWGRTPHGTSTTTAPSFRQTPSVRQPMPVGDLSGWRQVLAEDFGGASLDLSRWRAYYGQPGGDSAGWFDPRHVSVADGELVISGYRDGADGGKWATGGVALVSADALTYGKYLVRFRLDPGVGIGHTISLNTADGSWPPEIDFSEDNGGGRVSTLATLHYGPHDTKVSKRVPVDLTHWNTLGVEWLPGSLNFTLDGRVWFRIHNPAVPDVPMVLAIQTQSWPCTGSWGVCPNASTPAVVRMYVDWVVAYVPAARR